ncbi:MAG: class I SAM-dependent methyltransferase [Actinomycetes bacterium]
MRPVRPARPGRPARPVGTITRGTTAPNRLRRVDRWLLDTYAGLLRRADDPFVVDLGYGRAHWTTPERAERLAVIRSDVRVVGLEIDPARVAAALPYARPPRTTFGLGGFELPLDEHLPERRSGELGTVRPLIVRAFNVLRQYNEGEVAHAWRQLTSRLAPGGVVVEGTCDETGRLATWVDLGPHGPRTLTLAARLAALQRPSELAERLPKVLIHRNVPGERVHALFADLDAEWDRAAGWASFGARNRWQQTLQGLRQRGWPLTGPQTRWRPGQLTVAWSAVAPRDGEVARDRRPG